LQQTAQSTQALGFVGKTAVVKGSTAALGGSTATTGSTAAWELSVPTTSTVNVTIASSSGQAAFTGSYNVTAGNNQPFVWDGKGTDGTQWPDGNYTLTATAKDANNNSVAISTQVVGVVNSVDLTQSPPLLSIGGQTYTVSQIQSIVN
jgi:flagellar basal-body rod modification protein FlgD